MMNGAARSSVMVAELTLRSSELFRLLSHSSGEVSDLCRKSILHSALTKGWHDMLNDFFMGKRPKETQDRLTGQAAETVKNLLDTENGLEEVSFGHHYMIMQFKHHRQVRQAIHLISAPAMHAWPTHQIGDTIATRTRRYTDYDEINRPPHDTQSSSGEHAIMFQDTDSYTTQMDPNFNTWKKVMPSTLSTNGSHGTDVCVSFLPMNDELMPHFRLQTLPNNRLLVAPTHLPLHQFNKGFENSSRVSPLMEPFTTPVTEGGGLDFATWEKKRHAVDALAEMYSDRPTLKFQESGLSRFLRAFGLYGAGNRDVGLGKVAPDLGPADYAQPPVHWGEFNVMAHSFRNTGWPTPESEYHLFKDSTLPSLSVQFGTHGHDVVFTMTQYPLEDSSPQRNTPPEVPSYRKKGRGRGKAPISLSVGGKKKEAAAPQPALTDTGDKKTTIMFSKGDLYSSASFFGKRDTHTSPLDSVFRQALNTHRGVYHSCSIYDIKKEGEAIRPGDEQAITLGSLAIGRNLVNVIYFKEQSDLPDLVPKNRNPKGLVFSELTHSGTNERYYEVILSAKPDGDKKKKRRLLLKDLAIHARRKGSSLISSLSETDRPKALKLRKPQAKKDEGSEKDAPKAEPADPPTGAEGGSSPPTPSPSAPVTCPDEPKAEEEDPNDFDYFSQDGDGPLKQITAEEYAKLEAGEEIEQEEKDDGEAEKGKTLYVCAPTGLKAVVITGSKESMGAYLDGLSECGVQEFDVERSLPVARFGMESMAANWYQEQLEAFIGQQSFQRFIKSEEFQKKRDVSWDDLSVVMWDTGPGVVQEVEWTKEEETGEKGTQRMRSAVFVGRILNGAAFLDPTLLPPRQADLLQ